MAPQIFCGSLLLIIVWQLYSGLFTSSHEKMDIIKENIVVSKKYILDPKLFMTPIFGEYVPNNLHAANVKLSMLNLTVVGILLSQNEHESEVIIRSSDAQEKNYRVGDTLPGGSVIKRITKDGVLISNNNILERLDLPKFKLKFEATTPIVLEK